MIISVFIILFVLFHIQLFSYFCCVCMSLNIKCSVQFIVATLRSWTRHSAGRYSDFKYKTRANITTGSCFTCLHTTAVVNQARPSSRRRCGQLAVTSETLGTCCSQTLSTVLMTLKSNRKRVDFYSQCEILGLYVLRSRLHACVCVWLL